MQPLFGIIPIIIVRVRDAQRPAALPLGVGDLQRLQKRFVIFPAFEFDECLIEYGFEGELSVLLLL